MLYEDGVWEDDVDIYGAIKSYRRSRKAAALNLFLRNRDPGQDVEVAVLPGRRLHTPQAVDKTKVVQRVFLGGLRGYSGLSTAIK